MERIGIAVLIGDDLQNFEAFIKGPADCPYEDGTFTVTVKIPDSYPIKAPEVTFVTKIWHPNISSSSGFVCLSTFSTDWCGNMNLRAMLLSVQNLLRNPEPLDAQDEVVGRQCLRRMEVYRQTALQWTHIYAKGPRSVPEYNEKLSHMETLEVAKDLAVLALTKSDWNLDQALDEIYNV